MGLTEESGKVAGGIIVALRDQPAFLLLILLNMAFISTFFIVSQRQLEANWHALTLVLQACEVQIDEKAGQP